MLYVDSVLKSLESREEEKTCHSSVAFSLKFFLLLFFFASCTKSLHCVDLSAFSKEGRHSLT